MRVLGIRQCALGLLFLLACTGFAMAGDSSIYVQCPQATGTELHPAGDPGIKCGHLVAGDGMVTMADDGEKPLYVFSFARLPGGGPAPNSPEYPGWVMSEGMLAANAPAPTIDADEDDEVFITLTNVGMAMRPDLFDPHTIHWHGFPNAGSVFDGVPDSSVSINMGASLTYYYNTKDAGTYMYHCHVEAAEHMQMGMLGNLYVRPRQNRCDTIPDDPDVPGSVCPPMHVNGVTKYAYDDGDGSTSYTKEYPIQIGSFDPDFHDASFNVQPLPFAGMRDRYFLLNGRGYPDTVNPPSNRLYCADAATSCATEGADPACMGIGDGNCRLTTIDPLGKVQFSQPVSSLITASPGERVLLRISNLNVTKFDTIATLGIPMEVVGLDARLLRDGAGNNLYYKTHSLTLGGGQSADVILDMSGLTPGSVYFLYTTNLDHLANDSENFGGAMTEIRIN